MNNQVIQRLVISSIFLIVAFIYVLRLFFVQVIDDSYKLSANNNVVRQIVDYPVRGLIYDRNGKLLVYNEAAYDIMIIPSQIQEMDTTEFCSLVNISKDYFNSKLKKAKRYSYRRPSIFLKQLSSKDFAALQEKLHKFKGFYVQPRTVRKYPFKIAPHALGYIGEVNEKIIDKIPYYKSGDYIGISGIEQSYEQHLRGKRGLKYVFVDVFGREKGRFEDGKYDTIAVPGKNLTSSLDVELQMYGEALFQNKLGGAVAIEPQSGEILAMISAPGYDPNLMVGRSRNFNYSNLVNDALKPMFNRAMQANYPPGSTFKIVNALIAQQEGVSNENTYYGCNMGFHMRGLSIGCHRHSTPLNLQQSIQHSCNAYYCKTFRNLIDNDQYANSEQGYITWKNHVNSFGIGKKIGVDLPHELGGLVPKSEYYDKIFGKNRWKASNILSLSIGQGELGTTPLQLANMSAIIANGGYYYSPHVIKSIGDDELLPDKYTKKNFTTVKREYYTLVKDGMRDVVTKGTARNAEVKGLDICGKTGTAENPHGKDHSLFVAFAPQENPKIAVAVMVENGGWGTTWASPIASLMIEQYLTDSISRPWLEEHIMNGNLLPIVELDSENNPISLKN